MTLHFSSLFHLSVQFSRSVVSDSLCDSTDCSTPGLPIHHQLPEFTQTHVHWISDAIPPSHPVIPFSSHLQSFPEIGYFQMNQFFASVTLYKHKTERDLLNCLFQLPSSTEIPSLGFLTTRWPLLLFLQWWEHARFLTFFPAPPFSFSKLSLSIAWKDSIASFVDGILNQSSLPCHLPGKGESRSEGHLTQDMLIRFSFPVILGKKLAKGELLWWWYSKETVLTFYTSVTTAASVFAFLRLSTTNSPWNLSASSYLLIILFILLQLSRFFLLFMIKES